MAVPLAAAGWAFAGAASGAGSAPSMEVLPKPTGLSYGQTVEVKGHHLPKGSGSVAATICGLNDTSGKAIATPSADDCAGAAEIGKLVVVKSWQSSGEFDTKYTLPQSGQKFGTNARFCDRTHLCALVVADANPSAPAYHVETKIQFVDQAPTSSTTSAPKPTPTTTTPSTPTTQPDATATPATSTNEVSVALNAHTGTATGGGSPAFGVSAAATTPIPPAAGTASRPPSTASPAGASAVTAPLAQPLPAPVAQGLDHVCTKLADAVKQAGGDTTALLAACSAIESGNGPQQLATVLQSPSLLCIEGASAWQNNPQITAACDQAAAALTPVASQLGGLLAPVLPGP
jgi:hypothetical protein